jgi:hypothetical protein
LFQFTLIKVGIVNPPRKPGYPAQYADGALNASHAMIPSRANGNRSGIAVFIRKNRDQTSPYFPEILPFLPLYNPNIKYIMNMDAVQAIHLVLPGN